MSTVRIITLPMKSSSTKKSSIVWEHIDKITDPIKSKYKLCQHYEMI